MLLVDLVVGNAVIVTEPTPRHPAQLAKDILDAGIGKLLPGGKPPGQVTHDLPVRTCLARGLHRLPDADDTAFGVGNGAFVLFLQRARQDDIGMPGRFRHEKVDDAEELEPFERRPSVLGVRERHEGIETDAQQPPDLPAMDGLTHLRGSVADAWQFIFGHAPALGNDAAVLRIVDVPPTRELVTTLPMLPPALAISLAGDGRVPAAWLANLASGQDQVDARQTVFRALGVMFNAAGVQEHGCRCCAPPLRRLDNGCRRHAGECCHALWGVVGDSLLHLLKALCVLRNKGVIDPATRYADVQQAIHKGTVASRTHRQKEVSRTCDRGHAWINDNDSGAVVAGPPDIVGEDRKTLANVDPSQDETLCQRDVAPRLSAPVDAKRHTIRSPRRYHAEAPIVINMLRAQGQAGKFPYEIRLLVGERRS